MKRSGLNWRGALRCGGAAVSLLAAWGCEATLDESSGESGAQGSGSIFSGGDSDAGTGEGPGDGDASSLPPATDPGRVTLHRLNNTEYNNTVRDLLDTTLTPADSFPLDGSGAGFDNIADVLTLSEPHLVAYADATEALIADVLSNPELRARHVPCDVATEGASCIRTVARNLAPRAFRRPVPDEELSRIFGAVDASLAAGDAPEDALVIALSAILLSPHFLFRVELDPVPTSLEPHPLSDHELASRLSYFLWSSMPDEELFAAAEAGTLHDEAVLTAQVERMLVNERTRSLVENFAGQWLYLRKVDEVAPDPSTFPQFDPELRAAMKAETEMLFEQVAFGGLPANQLLTANFTFVNDRLAEHYGLPPVGSDAMTQVDLTGNVERPGGILGHGSVLTVTSHQSKTSPVLRGKWVMGQLLCLEVPPPPPDVNVNLNDAEITGTTLKEQLQQHRADPTCNSCHQLMDPIGLGLENYDAIGAFRATENGATIDSAGQLPDGRAFSGPSDLRTLVADDPGFTECLIKNLYTYALGRVPDETTSHMDGQTLAALDEEFRATMDFGTLVRSIVLSPTFLNRRGDPTEAGQ